MITELTTVVQVDVNQTPTKRFQAFPYPDKTPGDFKIEMETVKQRFRVLHLASKKELYIPMSNVSNYTEEKDPEPPPAQVKK